MGVNYFSSPMSRGMAIVDDSYWDVGVTITGSERPFEYSFGVTQGTPGWGSTPRDENTGKTVLGRVGLAPIPGLRLGISGAQGSYLKGVESSLPPGANLNDYHQRLTMADLEVLVGHAELRAEGAHNVWESPSLGDLEVNAGYAELKYLLSFGGFLAGRYDAERFAKISDSAGVRRPWDFDVTRFEVGAGYRFDPRFRAKVVYQSTNLEGAEPSGGDERYSLVAAQFSVSF